jgi:hypothetical protein
VGQRTERYSCLSVRAWPAVTHLNAREVSSLKIVLTDKQFKDPQVAQLLAALNRALDDLAAYGVTITGPEVEAQRAYHAAG